MTGHDLDAFLRARRIAVLAIPRAKDPPLTSPVWYEYDGNRFLVQVEATSAKAKLIARQGKTAVSLAIQSEAPPYRYAVAYGNAALRAQPEGDAELRRRMARRYFGRRAGQMYVAREERRGVGVQALRVIEIVPERFVAHDFRPEIDWLARLYFAIYRRLRPLPP